MIKYFCDRCNKDMTADHISDKMLAVVKPVLDEYGDVKQDGWLDLCCDCAQKYRKWIREGAVFNEP